MSEEMGAVLLKWKAQHAEERLAFGPAYRDDGWICAEADGSLVRPDTLTARFRALEKLAGVPHRGCTRAHTHATLALANGARLDVVSRQLGHSSVAITADRYGHPDDEAAASRARVPAEPWGDEEPPLVICEADATADVLRRVAAEYVTPITGTRGNTNGFLRTRWRPSPRTETSCTSATSTCPAR